MSEVFAFFGSDLGEDGSAFLLAQHEAGRDLLALDGEAIGAAQEAGAPVQLVDDWIDTESVLELKRAAAECEAAWYEDARDALTSNGICWPAFDHNILMWFWQDVLVAERMARAFRDRGVEGLHFALASPPRPLLWDLGPSDAAAAVWKQELGEIARPFDPATEPVAVAPGQAADPVSWSLRREMRKWEKRGSALFKRLGLRKARARDSAPGRDVLAGRFVFAINPHEAERFAPIVAAFERRHPGGSAGVILDDQPGWAADIAGRWGVPVLAGAPHVPAGEPLQTQLLGGVESLHASSPAPWKIALSAAAFQFEHMCMERWPALDAAFTFWKNLWSEARPRGVAVSALLDAESQLPGEAARRLGIPTVAVPHGAMSFGNHPEPSADSILCGAGIQRELFAGCGIDASRLQACRGVIVAHEYAPVAVDRESAGDARLRILGLTQQIGRPGTLASYTSARAQVRALRALATPPDELAAKISIGIKPHPMFPDEGVLRGAGREAWDAVLPRGHDLHELIAESDLVVGLNYWGSALVHALAAGKPVVHFWTDTAMGVSDFRPNETVWLPAGPLIRDAEALWDLVGAFLRDPGVAGEMRATARSFAARYIDDAEFPDLVDVLDAMTASKAHE